MLDSIEDRHFARQLGSSVGNLFSKSRTAKQRDRSIKNLLNPLSPIVRRYGELPLQRPRKNKRARKEGDHGGMAATVVDLPLEQQLERLCVNDEYAQHTFAPIQQDPGELPLSYYMTYVHLPIVVHICYHNYIGCVYY